MEQSEVIYAGMSGIPNSYKNTAFGLDLLTFCISLETKYNTINLSSGDVTHMIWMF